MQINATITQSADNCRSYLRADYYSADYYSMRYSLASMVGMATTFFSIFSVSCYGISLLSSSEDEITLTSTLIIPHITKTSSNNCLIYWKSSNLSDSYFAVYYMCIE